LIDKVLLKQEVKVCIRSLCLVHFEMELLKFSVAWWSYVQIWFSNARLSSFIKCFYIHSNIRERSFSLQSFHICFKIFAAIGSKLYVLCGFKHGIFQMELDRSTNDKQSWMIIFFHMVFRNMSVFESFYSVSKAYIKD
jgi:hypothetical protein